MFQLRDDARHFFAPIRSRLKLDFDMYYFCLVAGLATKTRDPETKNRKSRDLVDYFPGDYKGQAEVLVALVLGVELERLKVNPSDKASVRGVVKNLLDAKSPARLVSNAGIAAMNSYASAGCDVLRHQWFKEPPASVDFFLITFHEAINQETEGQSMVAVT